MGLRFERLLLIEALVVLGIARVGLRFCNFRQVRRFLLFLGNLGRAIARRRISPAVLVWAVETARRKTPLRSTCLPVALTAEALFNQFGHQPVLCIGASVDNGKFAAHAWLENDHVVMVGGPEAHIREFTRFPNFMDVL